MSETLLLPQPQQLQGLMDEDVASPVAITRPRARDAVIICLDHDTGLLETLYLIKTPANAEHLEHLSISTLPGNHDSAVLLANRDFLADPDV